MPLYVGQWQETWIWLPRRSIVTKRWAWGRCYCRVYMDGVGVQFYSGKQYIGKLDFAVAKIQGRL